MAHPIDSSLLLRRHCGLIVIAIVLLGCGRAWSQTVSTGALTGMVLDASGAVVPGAVIYLTNQETTVAGSVVSNEEGRFSFPLLLAGRYELRVEKMGFEPLTLRDVDVSVTETRRLELHLRLPTASEAVRVSSDPHMLQTDSSALGRLIDQSAVSDLPLATRNLAQIASLSPGVTAGVYNAGELGLGATAFSQITKSNDGIYVHGNRSYANNWQFEGVSVADVQGSGLYSGGIPIPSPDTIREFKVQTGLYDAAYGRYSGANVSIITKAGGNTYHGAIFEFLRNSSLNANDFFSNRTDQPRPTLTQNQFGFDFAGPIQKKKLFFFGAYQATRQVSGVAAGQARIACSASLSEPPLTNDRSPASLGQLFGGMKGALGGVAVNPNGSNINPVAIALLNFKLPDGSYLIPTPQTINPSVPFASQGFSTFAEPCHFNDDQFLTNADYVVSPKSKIAARFFFENDGETVTFPGNGSIQIANISGSPSTVDSGFRVVSLNHTYTVNDTWINEARFGYVRSEIQTRAHPPFKWSDVGVAGAETNGANDLPSLSISGSVSLASAFPQAYAQNSFVIDDTLTFVRGAHDIRFGGSLTRLQDNHDVTGFGSFVSFLSWPDFLLGLSASGNGTGTFSNVFSSLDLFGLLDRENRVWEGSSFVQDDYKINRHLTVNMGVRYDRIGQFGDKSGRNSSFDVSKADPNPPPGGSVAGYVVASNFPGNVPPGVVRTDNTFGTYGDGQNAIAPRIGFAWQFLPNTTSLVLRGGYGLFYSRPTGQAVLAGLTTAPFGMVRNVIGTANARATFQEPFAQPFPTSESFPLFSPYSANTTSTVLGLAPDFRPAIIQEQSLNIQDEFHNGWLLEIGYVGTHGTHLQQVCSLNQALSASPENPVRGTIANTLANISSRVPILGIPADSLREVESEGSSWYNGLEASLTKRLGHGLQFLSSYTFSKTLDTDGADINGNAAGNTLTLGDQNSPKQRWGRTSFDHTHRFVFSETWTPPSPASGALRELLGGWDLAAVVTIQSGSALTIADTNADNLFGISEDRAELTGNCTKGQLVTAGPIKSKLNNYLKASCFTAPPVIGADGMGTTFGNSGTGIADGPGQANLDLAVTKTIGLAWRLEGSTIAVRAEFFNALNHPQFANPDTNFTSPTFGVISSTAVNARVGQLALRLSF